MDPDVRVRSISDRTGLEALATLFMRVWGTGQPQMPFPLLRALSHTGGMVLGAYAAGRLVGGAVGLCGADPVRHGLHSHIVGVDGGARRTGVGTALKLAQRDWCLERGITTMTWTFDPLIRRNATFNIARLHAVGVAYHPDFYGPMEDAYNAGVPTDRVLARWDLTTDATTARAAPCAPAAGPDPTTERLPHRRLPVLDIGEDGRPRRLAPLPHPAPPPTGRPPRDPAPSTGAEVRLRVPEALHHDRELLSVWRPALREAMSPLLDAGYRWTGVTRDGWYVLTSSVTTPRKEHA
ncbi:GNAT family N-acetyltransferase [Streptomyces sp. NPDC096012]|uniref:GNAT family N-acetyltransferase n=1 Tax=Streptomyces sp. NPDC096012 TaxID=3155684 RepID=UPI00336AE56F